MSRVMQALARVLDDPSAADYLCRKPELTTACRYIELFELGTPESRQELFKEFAAICGPVEPPMAKMRGTISPWEWAAHLAGKDDSGLARTAHAAAAVWATGCGVRWRDHQAVGMC